MSLLGTMLLSGATARAQLTSAELLGTVTDDTGAVLVSAKVTVTNLGTNEIRKTKTNRTGDYVFTFLPPGTYLVQVEDPGFRGGTSQVTLVAGERARINVRMRVGKNNEILVVRTVTPLLQMDDSTIHSTVTERTVEDLPSSTRNLTSLVVLAPGVTEAASINGLGSGQRPDDRRQTTSFSVNGQDDVLNNHIIDGTDNNERVIGTIGVKPSLDAIEEIFVQTSEFAPEVGRAAGGVISIITKAGTNNFHGSLYEFIKNTIFNARNPFNPVPNATTTISPQSKLIQNDFGGSIGGPIHRDRTFFFAAYEGFRQVAGVPNPIFSSVPTLTERALGPQGIIDSDPQTAGLPVDPIAAKLFTLFPAPNTGEPGAISNNFVYVPSQTQFSHTGDARVDHRFGDSDIFYVRYTLNSVATNIPNNLPSVSIGGTLISPGSGDFGFSGPARNIANSLQSNYMHIFNPALLLEVKAAYTRINNASNSPNAGTNAATAVGFPSNVNFGPASTGLPLIDIVGLASLGDSEFVPLQDLDNTFQYNGAFTYNRGSHTIKGGVALIRRQTRELQSANANGQIRFGLPIDFNPLASFLVGAFVSENRANSLIPPDYRTWEPSIYYQDHWKVTRRITVNYGARYDIFTPFTEAHNRISNFDLKTEQLLVAGQDGVSSTAGVKTDYFNLAPRVGFAGLFGQGIVVRGGFALSYFPGNYTSNAALKNAPFTSVYSPACASALAVQIELHTPGSPVSPLCNSNNGQTTSLAQGIPAPVPQTINTKNLSLEAVQLDLKSGVVYQINLVAEKAFGQNVASVGYVGHLGRHLPIVINDINLPNPDSFPGPLPQNIGRPTATVLPNLGGVGFYLSEGSSTYHALQASLQRHYQRGLTIAANYTWSHAIDDAAGLSNEGQEGFSNANPYNIKGTESGNSDLDVRHRFVLSGSYELPFGRHLTGIKRMLLAGWQANEILVWNTGNPFSITDNFTSRSNSVFPSSISPGPTRPRQVAPASVPDPNVSEWFNRNAFINDSPQGTIGNTPRNSLYGPHFRHFDFSLCKAFTVKEQYRMQFRAEFFNATNTPSYFVANDQNHDVTTNLVASTLPASSAFGRIVRTNPAYTPRQIQLALKFLF
ncbi:MAG: carboxypeptidase regulatory-like domain-containing protein [Acidobacteriia bacterium]|nr:carboxypeptidase regulatory-like domain-containing protein [Terriglobia bacterium]